MCLHWPLLKPYIGLSGTRAAFSIASTNHTIRLVSDVCPRVMTVVGTVPVVVLGNYSVLASNRPSD